MPGNPGRRQTRGSGFQTFYYTNEQSARLMFYHDHAMGITRLNVYAGEAAGYLLQDPRNCELVARGLLPRAIRFRWSSRTRRSWMPQHRRPGSHLELGHRGASTYTDPLGSSCSCGSR